MIGTILDWFKIAIMNMMMKKFVINTKDNDEKTIMQMTM